MALKIRLRQHGRTNRSFYRLVVADVRSPRDGKYVETVGWYNPHEEEDERNLAVDTDRVAYWLENGAQATDKVEALLKRAAPEVMKKQREKAEEQARKQRDRRRAKRTAAKA